MGGALFLGTNLTMTVIKIVENKYGSRPVARISEGGLHECVHICMHKHARLVGLGAYSSRKFLEMRCSEIASETKCRAVVAVWLAEYCIQFLVVLICICQAR